MRAVDPLAVYAAVVATASVAWQIFTWLRKGPSLRGHATSDMIVVGGDRKDRNTYVSLQVFNVGDAPTTITNVVLMSFPGVLARWRNKPSKAAVVVPDPMHPVPHALPAGGRFMMKTLQTPDLEDWSRNDNLYMGVWHTMRHRPYLVRLRTIEQKPA